MHLPNITFRISRKFSIAQITECIERTLQGVFEHVRGDDVCDRDVMAVKEYLKNWVLFAAQYDVNEDMPSWNEYMVEARFPRFAIKACLNVSE